MKTRYIILAAIARSLIVVGLAMFVAWLFTSCAHTHIARTPPSAGFYGVINPGKPVFCVSADAAGLDQTQCSIVQTQLATINRAVGFELLHFAGWMPILDSSGIPEEHLDMIIIGTASLPGQVIGLTNPRVYSGHVILGTIILFDPVIWQHHQIASEAVVLHELLHAVGMQHNDPEGSTYYSVITPHYDPKVSTLTPADMAALRAVYQ